MKSTTKLVPLALLALSQGALAQQIPGAGTQLQQLTPPPTTVDKAPPQIRIEQGAAPATTASASTSVLVSDLQISGAHAYNSAELIRVAQFTPGSQLTLADLQAMAARITQHYRSHGYFVARAFLPAQDISNHVVTITVSEGQYGKISVRNHSHLSDHLANELLEGLDTGDTITLRPLEHRLLLLSDVPGVKVSSTLVPGSLPGSSDLIVDVAPGDRVSGLIDIDNAGNPYTGEIRVGATVNLNNLLGLGDVASFRGVTSGSGLKYGRASYQMQFGKATAGVAYSRLEYELGRQFKALGAHGTAEIASVYGAIPLIRSRDSNLYAGLAYEDRRFEDRMDLIPSANRSAGERAVIGSLYGNHHDESGNGVSSFYLAVTAGSLDIHTPTARLADAASARSNGSYQKLWFNVARDQPLSQWWSLHASLTGQIASKNLDSSEKMVLGGMDGIRAYPQGEAFGDQGYIASLEARYLLQPLSDRGHGQVSLLGFVDTGRVTVNKDPWFVGDNSRSLSAAGVGLMWVDPGNFAMRMYYAVKLGSEDAVSAPDKSGRFWIQMVKYF